MPQYISLKLAILYFITGGKRAKGSAFQTVSGMYRVTISKARLCLSTAAN